MNKSHGSPFDRGTADSYYRRPRNPHHWPAGTMHGKKFEADEMTAEEVIEYHAGFDYNENEIRDFKDWG